MTYRLRRALSAALAICVVGTAAGCAGSDGTEVEIGTLPGYEYRFASTRAHPCEAA
jgi:hypothetical protein